MPNLLFKLLGDASGLLRTFSGIRTDARRAGQAAGSEFDRGMREGAGGRMKSTAETGFKAATRFRGLLGGVLGSTAVQFGRSRIEEGARIGNLADQIGVNAEVLQRAELAQKLYGDQVLKSTEALQKAMDSLSNISVQSAKTISRLQEEAREWIKLGAEAQTVGGGAAAGGSGFIRGAINRNPILMNARILASALGGKPAKATQDELQKVVNELGGGKDAKETKAVANEVRAPITFPSGDALQRIGLFVGGAPVGPDRQLQRAQLAALQRIEANTRKTYENL